MKAKTIGEKIGNFCAFRERCTSEVEEKLRSLGCEPSEVQLWLEKLRAMEFLNDQRFAGLFARSKFNQKRWGRVKIRFELKKRHLSDLIIEKGILEIDEGDYLEGMESAMIKKASLLGKKVNNSRDKLYKYMTGKGFEQHLVIELLERRKDLWTS